MKPTAFIVRPLEGRAPLPGPRVYETWPEAASNLRALCANKSDPIHYQKIEVIIQFDNDTWERRRFDAQRGEEIVLKDVATFRANTLLWQRHPSRPRGG